MAQGMDEVDWMEGVALAMQGAEDGAGVAGGDVEECAGGATGLAAALLPVLEGGDADADHAGELALGNGEVAADGLDVGGDNFGDPGWLPSALADLVGLFEAGEEVFEVLFFHGSHSLTTARSFRSWSGVRSSWAFFGYGRSMNIVVGGSQ